MTSVFMSPQFEEWWRGIKCYPCLCVRACVRACVRPSVRYQNLVSAKQHQFKCGMLIYNIKTQVEFDLGYNSLIFDRVMGLL